MKTTKDDLLLLAQLLAAGTVELKVHEPVSLRKDLLFDLLSDASELSKIKEEVSKLSEETLGLHVRLAEIEELIGINIK